MPKGAQRIAGYILEDPARIVHMSITELSEATDSAEGAVSLTLTCLHFGPEKAVVEQTVSEASLV